MRPAILFLLALLIAGCEAQILYNQEPPATREVILDTDVSIVACNSHLFIPIMDAGPEAICINIFTAERSEEFGVDLSASSISLDNEPTQQLIELIPENNTPSNSRLLKAEIRRNHIARYSVARDGIPRVIILFPANGVSSSADQLEVSPMEARTVNLELLFTYDSQQHRDQRVFTITSQRKYYSILDL